MEWPWNGLGCPMVPYGALGFPMACEDGCRGVAWWCGVGYGGTCYCVWYMVLRDVIYVMQCHVCLCGACLSGECNDV